MKICVDVRCLMDGRRTGVEEYLLNLLLNMLEIDKKNEYVLFYNSYKRPRFNFSIFRQYENVTIRRFRFPNKLLNFFFWYLDWPKIDHLVGGADAVFMPNISFGSVSQNTKLFLTIHDLSFERMGQYFSLKRKLWHIFINPKKLCLRADKIIAVSDSTKKDIASWYKIPEQKIKTIYSAVCDRFRIIDRNNIELLKIKEKYKLSYKFILYFGTIEPRKNIVGVIRAYNKMQKIAQDSNDEEIKKYQLVIAGETGWLGEKIYKEVSDSPFRAKIRIIRSVKDNDKPYLYNLASLFVYPSFFEGFGFPPLEAMKCALPVIASNNSSLPEVVGDSGILIDPDKPDEIMRAMEVIIRNRELKETLVKKGLEKSKEFACWFVN
jgi:glycosyltransferase involved in cell wall biosynthesis